MNKPVWSIYAKGKITQWDAEENSSSNKVLDFKHHAWEVAKIAMRMASFNMIPHFSELYVYKVRNSLTHETKCVCSKSPYDLNILICESDWAFEVTEDAFIHAWQF